MKPNWTWKKATNLACAGIGLYVSLVAIACLGAEPNSSRSMAERPNIVLIFADDLGIADLACYGRTDHRTPHLDRLASEGIRFTCGYCALPICSASRAGLLTSKYPARLHLTSFLPGRPDAPTQRLLNAVIEPALVPSAQTLAEVLQREGYATGAFGKWHLGGGESAAMQQGFDVRSEPNGNGDPATTGGKNEFLITEQAIAFIQSPRDKPYFCYVPHHSPHILLREREATIASNANAWNPLYAATLESLDASIGKLLAAIDATEDRDNTLVIFASDNGGLHVPEGHREPVTHNGLFRAGKGYLYEGGLRVPLMIRWPARISAGKVMNDPVSLLDIVPTLLEAVDVDPARSIGPVDGQSLMKQWVSTSEAPTSTERTFYWHLPHYTNQGSKPSGAIRRGSWKLLEDFETGALELYDLNTDAGETQDRASSEPNVAKELHQALKNWRERVAAQICAPNPDFDVSLHDKLASAGDPSTIRGSQQTAQQIGDTWAEWRKVMNEAVAGRQPVLKNTQSAVRLLASSATVHGERLRYEPETFKNVLGYWTEVGDWAEWEFECPRAGKYALEIHCGCGSGNGGSEIEVVLETGDGNVQQVPWTVRETGHFQNIVIDRLGVVNLTNGTGRLSVRPKKKAAAAIVDIRQVILLPLP